MLLFVLPSLRRNSSKSWRYARSISSNRIFSDRNCERRDNKERCLDAEPYLPSVSSRSMVCFRYSPTVQLIFRPLVSKRLSSVTSTSNASKRLILRRSSSILVSMRSCNACNSGVWPITRWFSKSHSLMLSVTPVLMCLSFRFCVKRRWTGAAFWLFSLSLRKTALMLIFICLHCCANKFNQPI